MTTPAPRSRKKRIPTHSADRFGLALGGGCRRLRLALLLGIWGVRISFGGQMKILRIIGKSLISMGVGVLLFVAWTLWGTGIYTAREQAALAREFDRSPVL